MGDDADMPASSSASSLQIRLWGEPAVLLPGGAVVLLERRAAALLALAALSPGISRMRAATLLWPDSGDPRRNLRQQLLRFRQGFGRELLTGKDTLTLVRDALPVLDPQQDGAVLLGNFDFDDCEDFANWLSQQRLSQRQHALERARQLLSDAEAAGDLDAALAAAQALLALDDQLEEHHRGLMRVHYLRGEPAAGLAVYQGLVDMLGAFRSQRPSAASERLAATLQAGSSPGGRSVLEPGLDRKTTPSSLPVTLKRPPLLAGRDDELAAVLSHWAGGRAVWLEGEAGLGKSRLMSELLAGAQRLVAAAGRPGDAGAPYATLVRLLRPLLDATTDLTPPTRETLAHLMHLPNLPNLPPPARAEHGAAPVAPAAVGPAPIAGPPLRPGAMALAVTELLQHHGVLCVALDDLHFADEATLDLIAGLIANDDPPRRWLLAGRPAELPLAAQALRSSLTELQRLGVVVLSALDEAAVATVVDALGIDGLHGRTLAPALCRHTGGNPLFMLETLKHGLLDGSLARGQLPRPVGVASLIELRLQRLGETALTLARVAAIAGVDFSIELAEAAIGVRAVHLASAWTELQEAQVLRGESFAHDLVGDAALRSVPPVVARRVHAQCAQWLAARNVEPARVAWHWQRGGMPAEAGQAFVAAARRAEQAVRLQDEAALYGHAAQAFGEAGQHEERFQALVGRVRSLNQVRFDDQALLECRALAEAACNDSQRLRAKSELCGLLTERGEPQAALDAGHEALALARRLELPEWQVRTACHMASSLCRLGRADEALALLAPQRSWLDAQADDTLRMLWHGDWAAALGQAGRLNEAVAAFDVALLAARRGGLRDAEGRLLLNCSVSLRQSGQLDRALALSRQGQALSAERVPIDILVLARNEAETGHYSNALAALEPVLKVFEDRGTLFWAQACRMVLARLWLDLGQRARAVPLLQVEPADMPAWLRADRLLLQLELARAMEQPAAAGLLEEALALAGTDPQRGPGLAVRALRDLPPHQVAARAAGLSRALRAKERFGALSALNVHLARATLALGRTAQAAAAARAALAPFDDGCAPEAMYLPEACLVAWQALQQAGAPEEAAAALRTGTDWIRGRALPQVPAPFIDSFLRRNAVNRSLLAAAASTDTGR